MKTRRGEYSYASITEPSAARTASNSNQIEEQAICDTIFTFNSEDSSSSSDYDLIMEPEKKRMNYSESDQYYKDLVERVKLMFIEKQAWENIGREHGEQLTKECVTPLKSLGTDIIKEFNDNISMSRSTVNATSTPLPISESYDLHFGDLSDISKGNLDDPQVVSPAETPSDISFNSECEKSISHKTKQHKKGCDDKIQSGDVEDSLCNQSRNNNESQSETEICSNENFNTSDDGNNFDKNVNDPNFINKHLKNNVSGTDTHVDKVENVLKNKSDTADSMSNKTVLSTFMSIIVQLGNESEADWIESPSVSLDNMLTDIQCRSGYNSHTRISKGSIYNISSEMDALKVPVHVAINIQPDEIEDQEGNTVNKNELSSQELCKAHAVVEEDEIGSGSVESEDLNEITNEQLSNNEDVIEEEELTLCKSKELNEQPSYCEDVTEEEEIIPTKSELLNENSSNCTDVSEKDEEEKIITANSEELDKVSSVQSSNCEDVKEGEELTTDKFKELSDQCEDATEEEINTTKPEKLNEQSSYCDGVSEKKEEEVTTGKSEELNETIYEQSSVGEDIENSGKSDDGINSGANLLEVRVKTLLKRKSDVAIQTITLTESECKRVKRKSDVAIQTITQRHTESECKRVKTLKLLKKNFFKGDLRVYSVNIIK